MDVAIVRLPRIANHDDFAPLEHEAGVVVRFVDDADALRGADLVIVPGSKSTVADLAWLRETGIAAVVSERAAAGHPVLGICGGCQMLGQRVLDPARVESADQDVAGLGLLPLVTRFAREKTTARVRARALTDWFGGGGSAASSEVDGYEIHAGQVEAAAEAEPVAPAFELRARNGVAIAAPDGAVRGATIGTMIHGLFDNDAARAALLARLRQRRGLAAPVRRAPIPMSAEYDRLADVVQANLDWPAVRALIGP